MGGRQGQVVARGGSLVLDFYFRGERIRAVIKGLSSAKVAHRAAAERHLAAIQHEIALGTFNLAKHFPDHPRARHFRKGDSILIRDELDRWLEGKRRTCEQSTWRDYRSAVRHHLVPAFGELTLAELNARIIRDWYESTPLGNQRINNVLIPLRGVFADAYADELIDRNPLDRIKHLPRRTGEPDPFSPAEVQAILGACTGQVHNVFQFAFWTGLRTSELIALRWGDVNLGKGLAYIRRTRTRAEEKDRTKTESGVRQLQLLPPARDALLAQRKHTGKAGPVFLNPRTGEPWKHDGPLRKTAWRHVVKAAGVRYRTAYTTRHTFASTMLSMGMPPMWVAQQMGHRDWGMIRKVYGRWIPDADVIVRSKVEALWSQYGHKGASSA